MEFHVIYERNEMCVESYKVFVDCVVRNERDPAMAEEKGLSWEKYTNIILFFCVETPSKKLFGSPHFSVERIKMNCFKFPDPEKKRKTFL